MTRGYPKIGDVVLTTEAPLGEVAQIKFLPVALAQRIVTLRGKRDILDNGYLLYLLQSGEFQAKLVSCSSGTTVIGIKQSELRRIEVTLPPLEDQQAIAEILGTLDDRIDNLRQTNATLEAMAQALFKSWFVDFDGVLPDKRRAYTFGEIAIHCKGSVNPAAQPKTMFQHYSLPAFDAGQMPIAETGETIKSSKTPVPSGAVLVSKLNPHIPRIWFVGEVGDNAVCSTEFLVWTPKPGIGSAFVYFVANSTEFNTTMCQLATGTSNSHQRVRPAQLAQAHAAVASETRIAAFDDAVTPLLRKIEHNRQQATTLAQLRDTLLPRLISGKLPIPNPDTFLERFP